MTLGEFISNYRAEHKESLRSFSRRAELSPTYISYLEKGETQRGLKPVASIETYKSIAKAAGLSLDELVRVVDDEVTLNARADALETAYQKYISDEKKKVLDMVDGMSTDELKRLLKILEAIKGN